MPWLPQILTLGSNTSRPYENGYFLSQLLNHAPSIE
jgi:hypothetical protein